MNVDLVKAWNTPEARRMIPVELCRQHRVGPDRVLTVARWLAAQSNGDRQTWWGERAMADANGIQRRILRQCLDVLTTAGHLSSAYRHPHRAQVRTLAFPGGQGSGQGKWAGKAPASGQGNARRVGRESTAEWAGNDAASGQGSLPIKHRTKAQEKEQEKTTTTTTTTAGGRRGGKTLDQKHYADAFIGWAERAGGLTRGTERLANTGPLRLGLEQWRAAGWDPREVALWARTELGAGFVYLDVLLDPSTDPRPTAGLLVYRLRETAPPDLAAWRTERAEQEAKREAREAEDDVRRAEADAEYHAWLDDAEQERLGEQMAADLETVGIDPVAEQEHWNTLALLRDRDAHRLIAGEFDTRKALLIWRASPEGQAHYASAVAAAAEEQAS